MTKKERIVAIFTGISLFLTAALFSISLLLGILDFGTSSGKNFLTVLGQMLVSVYGICSILIPAFFFVAGAFCLSARWSIQRAFILLVSIIPFFTMVVSERICVAISDQDTSPLAFVKISTLVVISLLLVALEYLLAVNLASYIEHRINGTKVPRTKVPRTKVPETEMAEVKVPAQKKSAPLPKKSEPVAEEITEPVELNDVEEEISETEDQVSADTDQAETERKLRNLKSFAFLKTRPSHLKDLFVNKISFAGKRKPKEIDIESIDSGIELEENDVTENAASENIEIQKTISTPSETAAEPEIPETPKRKLSFNWSLDDKGNVKGKASEENSISAEEETEEDADEEIAIEDKVTIESAEDNEIAVPGDAEGSQESIDVSVFDDDLNDDVDVIDQFERESQSLTADIDSYDADASTDNEIQYDIAFEDETASSEENDSAEDDFSFLEDPEFNIDENDEPVESEENEETIDDSFMQDQIISGIENSAEENFQADKDDDEPEVQNDFSDDAISFEDDEHPDDTGIQDEPIEELQIQKDRTAQFNPDTTALGDIFTQMENDARQKVEFEANENVDPLAPAVVDSNGNPIKTAVTVSSDGTTKAAVVVPPKKKKKMGAYKIDTDLLTAYAENEYWIIDEETKQASLNLQETLKEFSIQAEVIGIRKGPVVTMFEILPAPGVKLSKIVGLADNIALRLAAQSVRIVAPIPGKRAVGIEIPNTNRAIVSFRECIEQNRPEWKKMSVPVILGKDIEGETQIMDLVKTPHLLIAGSTGAGKSVCVNSMILSILYKRSPSDVKMILIDPKVVELKLYNHIPHLLTPVITESKKAMQALQYCLCEMERRYAVLDSMGCRDISSYNRKIVEQHIATEKIPYLIVIIDEFADLMATTGKQLEGVVARLCAMSRAVGIHLVLATQRPSVDVITGLIKANIPSRVAFMVAAKTDSRIIIDQVGAEKLLGKGDMLYASATDPFPVRIQGAFVSDQEVENVVEAVKEWGEPEYIDDEIFVDDEDDESNGQMSLFNDGADDPLYDKALDIVIQAGKASASYIQRRLSIGYNRAARLVELMEERGIVGPANGSKPREIIHMP